MLDILFSFGQGLSAAAYGYGAYLVVKHGVGVPSQPAHGPRAYSSRTGDDDHALWQRYLAWDL